MPATSIFQACDDGGNPAVEQPQNSAARIHLEDFLAQNVVKLNEYDFREKLKYLQVFQYSPPKLFDPASDNVCVLQLIGDTTVTKNQDNTFKLVVNDTVWDNAANDCVLFSTGQTMNSVGGTVSFVYDHMVFLDGDANEVDVEGKALKDLLNLTLRQYNAKAYYDLKFMVDGAPVPFKMLSAIYSTSSINSPCSWNDIIDKCTTETILFHADEVEKTVIRFDSVSLADKGFTFYSGGSIFFEINNWTGVMKYSEIDATYTATDGSIELSGTYSEL